MKLDFGSWTKLNRLKKKIKCWTKLDRFGEDEDDMIFDLLNFSRPP